MNVQLFIYFMHFTLMSASSYCLLRSLPLLSPFFILTRFEIPLNSSFRKSIDHICTKVQFSVIQYAPLNGVGAL
jgi:hypothetical protein